MTSQLRSGGCNSCFTQARIPADVTVLDRPKTKNSGRIWASFRKHLSTSLGGFLWLDFREKGENSTFNQSSTGVFTLKFGGEKNHWFLKTLRSLVNLFEVKICRECYIPALQKQKHSFQLLFCFSVPIVNVFLSANVLIQQNFKMLGSHIQAGSQDGVLWRNKPC